MATKRQASDERTPQSSSSSSWKRRKPNDFPSRPNHGKNSFKKAHPVNELKSTIRSLRRLLDRGGEDLPATVRVEKERALQTAEHDLARAKRAKQRSDTIAKYHKIRFFERQKADRRLKKARKELHAAREGEQDLLRQKVHAAEVDLNYALYFPLEREYVKLWPREKKEAGEGGEGGATPPEREPAADEQRQGDEEMWLQVERCMEQGTLKDLREGTGTGPGEQQEQQAQEPVSKSHTPAKQRGRSRKTGTAETQKEKQRNDEKEESSDESGGGFFE